MIYKLQTIVSGKDIFFNKIIRYGPLQKTCRNHWKYVISFKRVQFNYSNQKFKKWFIQKPFNTLFKTVKSVISWYHPDNEERYFELLSWMPPVDILINYSNLSKRI